MSVTSVRLSTLQSGESAERGRAARRTTARSAHGDWAPAPDRPDPVAVLTAQAATRVQELVPIRYGRMLVSPFTFYRGAAAVMAADLATTPDSGIVVQACGDAHISNFGAFAAPDRRLIFSPNDFDETLPGPVGVGRQADGRQRRDRRPRRRAAGRSPARIVTDCVREYREGMRDFARESHLDVWYERLNASELVARFGGQAGPEGPDPVREAVREGAPQDEPARCQEAHRARRRRAALPQRAAAARARSASSSRLGRARRERLHIRAARAVRRQPRSPIVATCSRPTASSTWPARSSGVGSVGTRAWVFLLVGRDGRDPLVLQAKEAQASVLEPYLGASEFANHGERVVRGQRISIGGQRHLPQLAAQPRPRRRGARLLRAPAVGLEGVGRPRRR